MLKDVYNEDALDLLVDMIEPAGVIFKDAEVAKLIRAKNYIDGVKYVIKNYKKETIQLLAAANGQAVTEYKANILDMIHQLLELLNDPQVIEVFSLQALSADVTPLTPATQNTEATETT